MIKLTYYAEWHGERAAGINPGSEEIDITRQSPNNTSFFGQ